jgi:NAD(P)H-nitrite reductase large subunit
MDKHKANVRIEQANPYTPVRHSLWFLLARSYNERLTKQDDDMTFEEALSRLPDLLKRDLEQPLCVCNQVIKSDVIRVIADGAQTLQKVQQQTYASDGTGCCKRQIQALIKAIHDDRNTLSSSNASS